VDLALTALIIGIVAAVATPRFASTVQYYQVDAAARRIEADINYVQSSARLTNRSCSLTFSASQPTYTTTGVPHLDNSGRDYAVDLAALGYPVSLQVNLNGGRTISYSPTGVAQAGSPLTGLTTASITITAGAQTRAITVDPVTGKARRS
jgi:type II secretory pathway pseudopilin PulG